MILSFLQFCERFAKLKPSAHVYLLAGEEDYFIDRSIELLKKKWLGEDINEFNFTIFYGDDTDPSEIIDAADTLPLLTEKRMIVVKSVDKWTSNKKEAFIPYLKHPSNSTCLVLTSKQGDRRDKLTVAIDKYGIVVECKELGMEKLKGWIRKELRQAGKTIDEQALYMLIEATGDSMYDLANDMEKLILYTHGQKHITSRDIAMVSSKMRSVSVFEITNAIMKGIPQQALMLLHRALEDGEHPVRILYFITREFRLLLKIKALILKGFSPQEAIKKASIPSFKYNEFLKRVNTLSMDTLYMIYKKLISADLALKGGSSMKSVHLLEQLLLDVISYAYEGG